jgi:predicted MPP superfamily phosphohydrolase
VYSRNGSFLVVGGGLGTSGPPVRIGVAPEIAVICLRA